MGTAILPVIYLIFGYFSKPFAAGVNVFNDPRVEVSEGITTTANNLLVNNIITLPRFITGFFGSWGLGWFELELTQTVWLFTLQAFLLVVGFALRRSSNTHRLIVGALFAIMCAAILYANQQKFGKIGEYIQPRYFLPFFLGIVIIAAANKTERYPNSLVITVAILATISNSIALRDTIRRYTTGQDVFISKSLNNPIEWWWQFGPQPETVWLTGTLAFAALWAILIYDRNKEEADTPISPTPELAN
jgi:general stress protein CsbA